jgi:hypothetical protein
MFAQALGHPTEIPHGRHARRQEFARRFIGQCSHFFPGQVLHALDAAVGRMATELHIEVDMGVDQPGHQRTTTAIDDHHVGRLDDGQRFVRHFRDLIAGNEHVGFA